MKNQTIIICISVVVSAIWLAACSDSNTFGFAPGADQDSTVDGDGLDEFCEPDTTRCKGDSIVQVCNNTGVWVYQETCYHDTVCYEGECVDPDDVPVTDGDDDGIPDGDLTDGDDAVTDGDDEGIADGDLTDGDDAWHCAVNFDCPFGYACDPEGAGDGCYSADECSSDNDCDPGYLCQDGQHWKECLPRPDECDANFECEFGYACRESAFGYKDCVEANECDSDDDCAEHWICDVVENWNVCFPEGGMCNATEDCDFGYVCNLESDPPYCEYANTCNNDTDCGPFYVCAPAENWKECRLDTSPTFCQGDGDCGEGEYCEIVIGGYGSCRSLNECSSDSDCPQYFECAFNDEYYECIETVPCDKDSDCDFGYRCQTGSPRNECVYANECANDADCQLWETCQPGDNWMVCRIGGTGFCASDDDCAEDEYCDGLLGPAGTCRSLNQCYVDDDCGDGLVCRSNGTYNECVPSTTQSCWLDFQCPEGWRCVDQSCKPLYEGMCSEVEGQWTIFQSDCTLLPFGQSIEFIPLDGCKGDVDSSALSFSVGSFEKLEDGTYDIRLAFIMQCIGDVSLGSLMSMDCGNCSVELGHL